MKKYVMRKNTLVSMEILPVAVVVWTSIWLWAGSAQAQQETGSDVLPPPVNAHFVALSKCAACHFDQYKDWQLSEHAKAFEILPDKYRNDAACLKCHTTGKAGDVSSYAYGVSCQACHGPGGEHADFALRFITERITEERLKSLREKIQRLDMRQCVNCHISKAHQKHPPYDGQAELRRARQDQSISFFQSTHGDPPGDSSSSQRLTSQPLDDRLECNYELERASPAGVHHLPSGRLLRMDFLWPL